MLKNDLPEDDSKSFSEELFLMLDIRHTICPVVDHRCQERGRPELRISSSSCLTVCEGLCWHLLALFHWQRARAFELLPMEKNSDDSLCKGSIQTCDCSYPILRFWSSIETTYCKFQISLWQGIRRLGLHTRPSRISSNRLRQNWKSLVLLSIAC